MHLAPHSYRHPVRAARAHHDRPTGNLRYGRAHRGGDRDGAQLGIRASRCRAEGAGSAYRCTHVREGDSCDPQHGKSPRWGASSLGLTIATLARGLGGSGPEAHPSAHLRRRFELNRALPLLLTASIGPRHFCFARSSSRDVARFDDCSRRKGITMRLGAAGRRNRPAASRMRALAAHAGQAGGSSGGFARTAAATPRPALRATPAAAALAAKH